MITNKLENITPEIAEQLLATNDGGEFLNRPRSASVVAAYARDMAEGRWKRTHEAVAVYYDKLKKRWILVDGQHRMAAIIAVGKPVELLVARYGTKQEAMEAIQCVNIGKPRPVSQIGIMTGQVKDNGSARAAAANKYLQIMNGEDPTKSQVLELMSKQQGLFDELNMNWRAPGTSMAAFLIAAEAFGVDKVRTLAIKVSDNVGLTKQEALLYNQITEFHSYKRGAKQNASLRILRAIEACIKNQHLTKVRDTSREEMLKRLFPRKR